MAASVETAHQPGGQAPGQALAVATPIRTPVKLPGPSVTAIRSTGPPGDDRQPASTPSITGSIASA